MKYVIAGLVLALAGLGLAYNNVLGERANTKAALQVANAGLEQAAAQRKLDVKVLAARQAENAVQARKLAAANTALSAALRANKAWSEASVPPEVQEALIRRSGGSDAPAN